jgi:hypothetical protein
VLTGQLRLQLAPYNRTEVVGLASAAMVARAVGVGTVVGSVVEVEQRDEWRASLGLSDAGRRLLRGADYVERRPPLLTPAQLDGTVKPFIEAYAADKVQARLAEVRPRLAHWHYESGIHQNLASAMEYPVQILGSIGHNVLSEFKSLGPRAMNCICDQLSYIIHAKTARVIHRPRGLDGECVAVDRGGRRCPRCAQALRCCVAGVGGRRVGRGTGGGRGRGMRRRHAGEQGGPGGARHPGRAAAERRHAAAARQAATHAGTFHALSRPFRGMAWIV